MILRGFVKSNKKKSNRYFLLSLRILDSEFWIPRSLSEIPIALAGLRGSSLNRDDKNAIMQELAGTGVESLFFNKPGKMYSDPSISTLTIFLSSRQLVLGTPTIPFS